MRNSKSPVVIKKYGNRRLYDTDESRYITLEELSEKIRRGREVRVVGATGGEDLTQATLTQIIVENRGAAKMLPVPLLHQLIRLGDDALGEFFGRYVAWTLQLYMQAKRGAQQISPFNPFATVPFTAADTLARMFSGLSGWNASAPEPIPEAPPFSEPEPPEAEEDDDLSGDIASLRKEVEALRSELRKKRPKSR